LPPEALFLTQDQLFGALKKYPRVELSGVAEGEVGAAAGSDTTPLPALAVERRADDPLHRLRAFLEGFDGRALLLAESPGRRETMQDYFAEHGLTPRPAASYAEFLAAPDKTMLGVG